MEANPLPTAAAIERLVSDQPGIHHRLVARHMGISVATAHYHLRRLAGSGRLVMQRDGRYMRYFAPACGTTDMVLAGFLRRSTPRRLLDELLSGSSMTCRDLATRIGLHDRAISASLAKLHRAGILDRHRAGRHFLYSLSPAWSAAVASACAPTPRAPEPAVA
jgi:predicted transcriptional regulator